MTLIVHMGQTEPPTAEESEKLLNNLEALWDSRPELDKRAQIVSRTEKSQGKNLPTLLAFGRNRDEPMWHYEFKPHMTPNLVGDALDLLSYLYNEPPVRTMADRGETEWAEDKLWNWGHGLSSILDNADPKIRLNAQTLAYLQFDSPIDNPEDTGRSGISTTVLTADRWVAQYSRDRPDTIDAVLMLVSSELDISTASIASDGDRIEWFHYWDRSHTATVQRKVRTRGNSALSRAKWELMEVDGQTFMSHDYKRPPVVVLPDELDAVGAWAPPGLGGEDLEPMLLSVHRAATEYLATAMIQRGQPWRVSDGDRADKPISLGPDCVVTVSQTSGFGIASSGADLGGQLAALEAALAEFAVTCGLPPDTWRISMPSIETGAAIYARRVRLVEDRREMPLHELAATIWNVHTGEDISGKLESVEYNMSPPVLTPDQLQKQLAFELDVGVASRREVKQRLNPTLSNEEIDARLADAKADLDEAVEQQKEIAGREPGNPNPEQEGGDGGEGTEADRRLEASPVDESGGNNT
jgi:hypothetical protein